jgi:hypothetical protein
MTSRKSIQVRVQRLWRHENQYNCVSNIYDVTKIIQLRVQHLWRHENQCHWSDYIAAAIDECMMLTAKPQYSEETCPSATISTTTLTWTDLGSNKGLRGERSANNSLSRGTLDINPLRTQHKDPLRTAQ